MAGDIGCRKLSKKLGTWANVTKVIMGLCFLIIFILGVALFGVSIAALTGSSLLADIPIKGFTALMYMGLFLGLFLAIVSILGAIGFFTLNKVLLIIVICLLAVLAILQLTCGSLAFVYRKDYNELFATAWNDTDSSTRESLEKTFHCCGGINSKDLPESDHCVPHPPPTPASSSSAPPAPSSSTPVTSSSASASDSSNATSAQFEGLTASASSEPWADGCVPKLAQLAEDQIVTVGACVIVVTILEIAAIVVTIIVVVKINRATSYYQVRDDDAIDILQS